MAWQSFTFTIDDISKRFPDVLSLISENDLTLYMANAKFYVEEQVLKPLVFKRFQDANKEFPDDLPNGNYSDILDAILSDSYEAIKYLMSMRTIFYYYILCKDEENIQIWKQLFDDAPRDIINMMIDVEKDDNILDDQIGIPINIYESLNNRIR